MRKGFTLIELMIVIAIIAIIASIAIPNLMESRVTANESAASGSLKSGVFAAQTTFQGGGNQDLDADNVGEYGTLKALAGLIATNKIVAGNIHLLQGPLANAGNWSGGSGAVPATVATSACALGSANGYTFTSYVGSEVIPATGVSQDIWVEGDLAPTALITATNNANNGETYYVVGCAPAKFGDTGRRVFVMTTDGQIRSPSRMHGVAAFYNSAGTDPATSGANKVPTAALMAQGIGYSYNSTSYPAAPAATTAAALTDKIVYTTFDTNPPNMFEFFSK